MAVTSKCILNDGMANVAKLLAQLSGNHFYKGIGTGNGTAAANPADTDLKGTETAYATPTTMEYVAANKCKWEEVFDYSDLTSHVHSEVVICESDASHDGKCLLRAVHDNETLGEDDTLKYTVTVEVKQGS